MLKSAPERKDWTAPAPEEPLVEPVNRTGFNTLAQYVKEYRCGEIQKGDAMILKLDVQQIDPIPMRSDGNDPPSVFGSRVPTSQ
jgi:hypothetical protein